MLQPNRSDLSWRRSSQCDTNTCLEVTDSNGLLWLRNSSNPEIRVSCTAAEWERFRDALIRGEFSDLEIGPIP